MKTKSLILICSLIIMIIIGFIFLKLVFFPKGEVVAKNISGFLVFSKNTNLILIEDRTTKGGVSLLDLESGSNIKLQNSEYMLGYYEVFSPSGGKIIYPGNRINGSPPNYNHNLYLFDKDTQETTLLTKNNKYKLSSFHFPTLYTWIDEDNIVYQCEFDEEKGENNYCVLNLNNYSILLKDNMPSEVSKRESNVLQGKFLSSHVECMPNANSTLCVDSNQRIEQPPGDGGYFIYELYIKGTERSKLIFRTLGAGPSRGVYWSKEDNVYGLFYNGDLVKF